MEFIDGCKIINAPTFFDDWDYARDVPALHAALAPWPCCDGVPEKDNLKDILQNIIITRMAPHGQVAAIA